MLFSWLNSTISQDCVGNRLRSVFAHFTPAKPPPTMMIRVMPMTLMVSRRSGIA